jgi:hypothetical protein
MQRQHPFLSLNGFILTFLLLVGLGTVLLLHGGVAFNPGPLSARSAAGVTYAGYEAHADFEGGCRLCHAPLETTQDALCSKCHTGVADEILSQNGTHGQIAEVNRCAVCHPDHRGRDFDSTQLAMQKFDHSRTHFSLLRHALDYELPAATAGAARVQLRLGIQALPDAAEGRPLVCADCHVREDKFAASAQLCEQCHSRHDPEFMIRHMQDYGSTSSEAAGRNDRCLACHDGVDRMARFDHAATSFPLDGKHAQAACADCHGPGKPGFLITIAGSGDKLPFRGTPNACQACHAEPDRHRGLFSNACVDCHGSAGWSPARLDEVTFDHEQTRFSLRHHTQDFGGQPISCQVCHPDGVDRSNLGACASCHSAGDERVAFMAAHTAKYGPSCLDCHDGLDRMQGFDHNLVFQLDGRHSEITCEACHSEHVFRGTPKECVACHAEPEIHAGFFGTSCQYCHLTTAWAPAELIAHNFPLDHGDQGEIDCKTCHNEYYSEYTCYGCHEHQAEEIIERHTRESVSDEDLPACSTCHPKGI